MSKRPAVGLSDVDELLDLLDVEAVAFTECMVQRGWGLSFAAHDLPGLHYVLHGEGSISVGGGAPIRLEPRSMIVTPPHQAYRIEVDGAPAIPAQAVPGSTVPIEPDGAFYQNYAGRDGVDLMFVCGHFRSSRSTAFDLFETLDSPIIERFDSADSPTQLLSLLRVELAEHRLGMRAMASALLKQILVKLFRRALVSSVGWRDRLAVLGDSKVSKAFTAMIADPAKPHSIESLSTVACLSRSAFMTRFVKAFGDPPSTVLRRIRLDRAAELLRTGRYNATEVASLVGYSTYSGFIRAFRRRHQVDPGNWAEGTLRTGDPSTA